MTQTDSKPKSTGQLVLLAIVFGAVAGAVGAVVGHLVGVSGETAGVITTGAGAGVATYLISEQRKGK